MPIKYHIAVALFLLLTNNSFSQNTIDTNATTKSKTYAIVIGISNYENASIPKLNYSHKDATQFYEWLKSKPGGSVPDYQIKLLTNEQATISAIYNGLDWLREMVQKGDIVYFYFSGHGDMEIDSASISQGYLLAYNSPSNNYAKNAVSINDINYTANILSTKNEAQLVLITDACHSGKLAGDFFKGKQLSSKNLRAVQNTQIRITSCAENEEAAEGTAWGGGSGVFSYYLLMGLNGMADSIKDNEVKLFELNNYLSSAISKDETLLNDNFKQHPVITGNNLIPIAPIDSFTLKLMQEGIKNKIKPIINLQSGLQSLSNLGIQPIDQFFEFAKTENFDLETDFSEYLNITIDSIPARIVSNYLAKIEKSKSELSLWDQFGNYDNTILVKAESNIAKIKTLHYQLNSLKSVGTRFKQKFVQMVHDKAQLLINAYLKGDIAELEKRQYYYSGNRTYTAFLTQIDLALKLSTPLSYIENLLLTQERYLTGLNARLEMETSFNTDSLLNAALACQYQALKYNPYAPYINNEIGNLYIQKKMYDSAEYHFSIASVLAPTWAIPWSNKIKLYLANNNLPKAKEAITNALALQPNLAFVKVNAGLVMEKEKNLLAAITYYQQAIAQNNIHYLPFERLGMVYIETGDYAKADYYFYEAKKRKETFNINDLLFTTGVALNIPFNDFPPVPNCSKDSLISNTILQSYLLLDEAIILYNTDSGKAEAKQKFAKALNKNTDLPLAHHFLGKIYFEQKHWQIAEQEIRLAIKNYKVKSELNNFLTKSLLDTTIYDVAKCIVDKIVENVYEQTEDYYILANIFENTKRNEDATKTYEQITIIENKGLLDQAAFIGIDDIIWSRQYLWQSKLSSENDYLSFVATEKYNEGLLLGGYIKASKAYETAGNYEKAEKILLNQLQIANDAIHIRMGIINDKKKSSKIVFDTKYNEYWYAYNHQPESETYWFYKRMLALNPLNPDPVWKEKAALFLYRRLALTYNQLPINEQHQFYKTLQNQMHLVLQIGSYQWSEFINSLPKHGYPLLPFLHNWPNRTIIFKLPATNEIIYFHNPQTDIVIEALELMKQAIKFSGDVIPRRELREALADLYSWTNNSDDALPIYTTLISQAPHDLNLRNKLIAKLITFGSLVQARNHLDTLYVNGQILKNQLVTLANYQILSGQKTKAEIVIKNVKFIDIFQKDSLMNFYARKNWLNNKPQKALKYLKDSLQQIAIIKRDSWRPIFHENDQAFFRLYAIARMYGMMKKYKKAKIILDSLQNSGFEYNYMLNNDPVWKSIKYKSIWQSILYKSQNVFMDYNVEKAEELNKSNWFKIPLKTFHGQNTNGQ